MSDEIIPWFWKKRYPHAPQSLRYNAPGGWSLDPAYGGGWTVMRTGSSVNGFCLERWHCADIDEVTKILNENGVCVE